MKSRVHYATTFALYQFTVAIGILAMPLAIAASQAGFTIPVHRLLTRTEEVYDDARAAME